MAEQNYIYAVARIRAQELSLLNASFLDQLITSADEEAAVKMLEEHGWEESESVEEMLTSEQDKTWQLISELVGGDMSVFNVFLYEKDFHNLKAAIKETCTGGTHPGIYVAGGTLNPEDLERAIKERDFASLPENMRHVAEEATDVLLKTRDGQLCDCMVDRAALEAIHQATKHMSNELLALYGELRVATADMKIAVRGAKTGKSKEFLQTALAECDSISATALADAAANSMEAIYTYLESVGYSDAVEEMKKSPAAFEAWCDNIIIRKIRPQLYQPFGLGPLAAFILARDNEIKTVRIILSGKRNGFSEEYIRGRVRETYV